MIKEDLPRVVKEALMANGGKGTIVGVCKYVWTNYNKDLENSGDLFYTWQYDIRWAATNLRGKGIMKSVDDSPKGIWELL